MPSFFCMSSSVIPLVSGYQKSTTKNCTAIIAEKNTNGYPPDFAATAGNPREIIPAISQCEKLPRLCPAARTRFGNTSPMYTQITAPCEKAKNAMYATSSQTSSDSWLCDKNTYDTPARHTVVPTAPVSSSFLRPTLSISDMAIIVNSRLVAPIATACKSEDTLLKPACAKIWFR